MIRARSTNERVLARHHAFLKRRPAAVAPIRNDDDDDDTDTDTDDDEPNPRGGRKGDDERTIRPTPVRPTPSVTPPVPILQTVRPTIPTPVVTRPALPTSVTNVLSTPVTSAPPTLVSSPPVSKAPIVSSSPATTTPVLTTPPSTPTTPQTDILGASATQASEGSGAASTTSGKSQGVSPGAIGGTVAVLVIVALGIIAFFVRRHHQRRRAMRRNTWGAGLVPSLETKQQSTAFNDQAQFDRPMSPYGGIAGHERLANVPSTSEMSQTPAPYAFGPPPPPPKGSGTPVPQGYNSGLNRPSSAYNPSLSSAPMSPFVAPSVPAASLRSVTPSMSPMHAAPAVEHTIVNRTFVPSLPDELHISNGEQIRVLSAYDDGWALCANGRGEQGVVPLECLQRSGGAPVEMQLQPDSGIGGAESNRTSRRISSLVPYAPGTY